ncbi:pyridoxamine 5'-phosphate oxidase family protein [Culicoidibacter larvae]|nr:pyridoxamine 5'-phosphate oxidase family protein [Culicoidibacter larvae]
MEKERALDRMRTIMRDVAVAEFSTIGQDGFPYTRAVVNVASIRDYPDLTSYLELFPKDELFVVSEATSEKMKQVRANNKVSLYVLNTLTYEWVMVGGIAVELKDQAIKEHMWRSRWKTTYVNPEDPNFVVIKIKAKFIRFANETIYLND